MYPFPNRYTWSDDNIGPDHISNGICPDHTTEDVNVLATKLKQVFNPQESIFPLHMRTFCHETLSHIFQVSLGGYRSDVNKCVILLENNGFVAIASGEVGTHSKAYSLGSGFCQFKRTGDRKRHQIINIFVDYDQIKECEDLLIGIVQNLKS